MFSDIVQPRGDSLAWVPGEPRQENFPSTVAYLARLILHRYVRLWVLDQNGYPIEEKGLIPFEADKVSRLRASTGGVMEVHPGKRCGECGHYAAAFGSVHSTGAVGQAKINATKPIRLQVQPRIRRPERAG